MKKDKMKLAGLLLAVACVSCGAGGIVAGNAAGNNVVVQAEETVEYTTYTITKIGVAGTQAAETINIYSLAGDGLPKDKGNWNDVYTFEAGSGAGVMLNGTALTGIKQPGDLYVPLGKMPEEACEGKTRTIHHGFYHRMIQSGIHDDTQLKPIPACLHELAQRKSGRLALCLFGHFASVTFSCGPNPCGRRGRCPCAP